MSALIDDVRALVHLYGRVPKQTVIHILNQMNEDTMDENMIDDLINAEQLRSYNINIKDGNYVLHSFAELDYDAEELQVKEQQPYYMPLGYDLEYYQDEDYFESTSAFDDLLELLQTCYIRKKKARKVAHGIQFHCRSAKRLEHLPSYLNRQRLKLTPEGTDLFKEHILNLVHQTRMYDLNGHTPNELGWKIDIDMVL